MNTQPSIPPPIPVRRPGQKETQVEVFQLLCPSDAVPGDLEEGTIFFVTHKTPLDWRCKSGTLEFHLPSDWAVENAAQIENPLHESSKRGNAALVTELLINGISVNVLDKAGNSALHWACRSGHLDVVSSLLEHSPAINCQNKMGDTPLHLAAWGNHMQVVHLLLNQSDLDVTLKNAQGQSPEDLARNVDIGALLHLCASKVSVSDTEYDSGSD